MSEMPKLKYLAWNPTAKRMAPVAVLNLSGQYAIVDLPDKQESWPFWQIALLESTHQVISGVEVFEGEIWEFPSGFRGEVAEVNGSWVLKKKMPVGWQTEPFHSGMVYVGNKWETPELVTN